MKRTLLIIDMQMFIQERINSGQDFYPTNAIANMTATIEHFRKNNHAVIHIMHQTEALESTLHPHSKSYPMMEATKNLPNEPVFIKKTSSAFASTQLEDYLKEIKADQIFVIGGVTGFCVNSTVRHGSDLGFKMHVIEDATISFSLPTDELDAKTIHQVTLKLLKADFAEMICCDAL